MPYCKSQAHVESLRFRAEISPDNLNNADNRLRIVQVIPNLTFERMGGPMQQVHKLGLHLISQGNECVVHTSCGSALGGKSPSTRIIQGVEYVFHPARIGFGHIQPTPGLFKALMRDSADVIHAHGYRDFQTSLGALAARLMKVPFVLSPHGSLLHHKGRPDLGAEKLVYNLFDLFSLKFVPGAATRIIVESSRERNDAIRFGIHPSKLNLIRYGFDLSLSRGDSTHHISRRRLLTVSRLTRVRNIESLIRVISKLKDKIPNVELKIVGDEFPSTFASGERGYLTYLQRLAADLGVSNNVTFLGWLTGNDLWKEYRSCDVFVWSSLYDSFAYELVEAAAFGKPIVTTPVGIADELVQSGVNGFLVDFGDIESLADAVERLLNDDELYRAASLSIREKAAFFSHETMINEHVALYQSLADGTNF